MPVTLLVKIADVLHRGLARPRLSALAATRNTDGAAAGRPSTVGCHRPVFLVKSAACLAGSGEATGKVGVA